MGEKKALEILKNLNATISKLSAEKRTDRNTVESESTAFKSSRAKLSELKRKRTELITKYKLNGTDY